jgi:hypothetical protein
MTDGNELSVPEMQWMHLLRLRAGVVKFDSIELCARPQRNTESQVIRSRGRPSNPN